MPAPSLETTSAPPPKPSFWRRRLIDPVYQLLTQGVTPRRIAATFAVGTACSLFPFFGFTTGLNLAVGLRLRMNQPLMQTLNYLLTPIHLLMIPVYVRTGEIIWRAEAQSFSVTELFTTFRDATLPEFIHRFGWAGIHALTAWALTAPLIVACIYFPLRPVMFKLARARRLLAGELP